MEVTATRLLQTPVDHRFEHVDTEVTIDGHRLLTIETHDAGTVSAWLFGSARRPNTRHDGYVVSVAVEREDVTYDRNGVADTPLDLLTCCIGSHCLIFHLPDPNEKARSYGRFDPTSLRNFFDHDSVTVVGVNMRYAAEKLERDFGVKIVNWFDLNELAVRAMGREDLDLARYGLDRLARTVLGKRWDVLRDDDVKPLADWYDCEVLDDDQYYYYYELPLCLRKIKSVTVDTYLAFMTGTKLLEMLRSPPPSTDLAASTSSEKKKKKVRVKEKERKKKKNRNGSAGGGNKNKYFDDLDL